MIDMHTRHCCQTRQAGTAGDRLVHGCMSCSCEPSGGRACLQGVWPSCSALIAEFLQMQAVLLQGRVLSLLNLH